MQSESYPCSICGKEVTNDDAILCNSCDLWVHPDCNCLSRSEFDDLVNSEDSEPWSCLKCNLNALSHVDNSCEYFDVSSFNSENFGINSLSFLHSNICSLDKHFDNFYAFLNSLNHSFKVIGLTETRIKSEDINFKIDNYSSFHTPTEADAGGTRWFFSLH